MTAHPINRPHGEPLVTLQRKLGIATAALVCGVLAFLLAIIPFVGLILGLPAVILGAISYRAQQGLALGAIITGAIGVLAGLAWAVFIWVLTLV